VTLAECKGKKCKLPEWEMSYIDNDYFFSAHSKHGRPNLSIADAQRTDWEIIKEKKKVVFCAAWIHKDGIVFPSTNILDGLGELVGKITTVTVEWEVDSDLP